jgi:hypothetical protein
MTLLEPNRRHKRIEISLRFIVNSLLENLGKCRGNQKAPHVH